MNRRNTWLTLVVVLLLATTIATQSTSATAPDRGSSAFGQGSFSFFNPFRQVPQAEGWDFFFDVTANQKGHARGRAIFNISTLTAATEVVVKIHCADVQGTSGSASATMTGTVLHSDNPDYPKGEEVVFAAQDNSNSSIFHFDIITPLFLSFEKFNGNCHEVGPPLTMIQVGSGSITIEP